MAKAYRALCTPEFMVFDSKLELQYHGQFDSARPSRDVPVTGIATAHWLLMHASAVASAQCPMAFVIQLPSSMPEGSMPS